MTVPVVQTDKKRRRPLLALSLIVLFTCSTFLFPYRFTLPVHASDSQAQQHPAVDSEITRIEGEWILKWEKGVTRDQVHRVLQQDIGDVKLIHVHDAYRVMVIRVPDDTPAGRIPELHQQRPGLFAYIQPNYTYQAQIKEKTLVVPDDPKFMQQKHLAMIKASEGWNVARENTDIVIALLDTGVDATHPDLKGNLIPGINMLDESRKPVDDNGHGTKVAGILGAVGNNEQGVSGILWKARMMPVKILNQNGVGRDFTVGMGIRRAVDEGARIVVMPLGLPQYSPHLQDAVKYARSKNVLIVAATGNDRTRVHYPASLPGVLAVGAVDNNKHTLSYANVGPELDVVAPGKNILTTAPGGGYQLVEGTSMAAPQVAGLAALLLKQHPSWTPDQLIAHIQATAEDLYTPGWDLKSGYGLINLASALNTASTPDLSEPNNSRQQAATASIAGEWSARLSGDDRSDWYKIESPYAGTLEVRVSFNGSPTKPVHMTHYVGNEPDARKTDQLRTDGTFTLTVPKGVSYLVLSTDTPPSGPITYTVKNRFRIGADKYEDNDDKLKAYPIARNGSITGTLHRDNDQDWYVTYIPTRGKLDIGVTVDTIRMDTVLVIQKEGEASIMVDEGNIQNGQSEYTSQEVEPGKYYILIHQYDGHPVNGEYQLSLHYQAEKTDGNEPNNSLDEATALTYDRTYFGTLPKLSDFDWFQFEAKEKGAIKLAINNVEQGAELRAVLYDREFTMLEYKHFKPTETNWTLVRNLDPGTYYLRLDALEEIRFQQYQLTVQWGSPIVYEDTWGHWARESIEKLSRKGIIHGYEDGTFRPGKTLTRAEFMAMLHRAVQDQSLELPREEVLAERDRQFAAMKDADPDHWAYEAMKTAVRYGWIVGYPDQTLKMNRPVTRAEMAVIVNRVIRQVESLPPTEKGNRQTFADVPDDSWMYPDVMALREKGYLQGYLEGVEQNHFYPARNVTRAEFAVMVDLIFVE
ncbi:MAG: S8 family serine peptidase [Bacillaceae bacterium]|nr:S8 family serine peptidase [Bacillaceae bacterium]